MINREYSRFVARAETPSHVSFIRSLHGGGAGRASGVKSILELVFSHKKAVFSDVKCNLTSKNGKCTIGDESGDRYCEYERAKYFYDSFYIPPSLHKDVSIDTEPVLVDTFVQRLTTFPRASAANKLTFLLGGVGSGKTAFINYLITQFGRKWFDNNILFVRIDVHSGSIATTYNDLLTNIYRKLKKIIRSKDVAERLLSSTRPLAYDGLNNYAGTYGEKESELALVLKDIREKTNRKVLIIIDNLDQIYHKDDRKRFLQAIPIEHDSIKPVMDLVTAFFHERTELGSIGANVLFSLRHDTYDILSQTAEYVFSPTNITKHNANAFTLENCNLVPIVNKRLSMLKEIYSCCEIPAGKVEDVEEVVALLQDEISLDKSKDQSLVTQLFKITSFGLRCVMDFFAQYSWINDDIYVLHRLIYQQPVGLLAYMLGGYRRFNQVRARFPNLYLINSKINSHPPTYWLKRLLAEYIHFNQKNSLETDVVTILNIFSDENITGGYPKDIVLECLGSLCEVHESNVAHHVLRVSPTKDSINPNIISLTTRGHHLLDYMKDKFIYLQLIVDDNYMPIPQLMMTNFAYDVDLDYRYLTLHGAEYNKYIKLMIHHKAKRVLNFLELLESAKVYEEIVYERVWQYVKQVGIHISVDDTRIKVIKELEAINFRLKLNLPFESYLKENKKLRQEIDLFFESCLPLSGS